MLLRVSFVQINVGGFNGQFAAEGHRISRVNHQIHDHLFYLPGISLDVSQLFLKRGSQLDVLCDHSSKHLFQVCNYEIEIEHYRLQDLLPTESKELPG